MKKKKIEEMLIVLTGRGGIIVFFIMAFEVMIMISPFAFFFYSVFNPIFKWLDQYAATSWLTSFFLVYMILPPTLFLKTVRVFGSVFFIIGSLTFIICALQVYLGKIFKWGVANKGLYKYIRHPQYLALGIWGIGMSILWPRFIVLVSLSLTFLLYYLLAKDEQRRMIDHYGETYKKYMEKTGMFFPRFIEKRFSFINQIIPNNSSRYIVIPIIIIAIVMGTGFILRGITLNSLTFESRNNIALLSMLPEDKELSVNAINAIIKAQADGKLESIKKDKDYLGYLMPSDYVMQGMVANRDDVLHLFKQHNVVMMIAERVLHPFRHLRSYPSFHMALMHNAGPAVEINDSLSDCNSRSRRRVIIDEVSNLNGTHATGKGMLLFNAIRVPVYSIDINTKSGEIVKIQKVESTTAGQHVPTTAI